MSKLSTTMLPENPKGYSRSDETDTDVEDYDTTDVMESI